MIGVHPSYYMQAGGAPPSYPQNAPQPVPQQAAMQQPFLVPTYSGGLTQQAAMQQFAMPQQQQQQQPVYYYVVQTPQGQQLMPVQQAFAPAPQMASNSVPGGNGSQTMYVQPTQFVQLASGSQTQQPYYVMQPVASIPSAETSQVMMSSSASHGASATLRPPTDVNVWGFAVVDQYHPSLQRIPVPPSVVTRTRGTAAYNNDVQASSTKPCASTVCLRFTSRNAPAAESCPSGEHCTGFHVERSYLEAARRVSEPLCCALHNDYFSQEMLQSDCAPQLNQQRFTLVLEDRAEVELTLAQVSLTVGLDQLTSRGVASSAQTKVISLRKQVCRLHFEGKCKWTKDCGHVHLCRELHRFLLSFHFPSLSFLLSTEQSIERLVAKLNDEQQLLQYARSKCVLPMITQLLDAKKYAAVEAIVAVGGCLTPALKEQIEAIPEAAGLQRVLANATIVQIPEPVQQRLRPTGRSAPAAAPSPPRVPSSSTTPVAFSTVDPASIWSPPRVIEETETGLGQSPTSRMPAFSPGASVTSLQGRPEGRSLSQH